MAKYRYDPYATDYWKDGMTDHFIEDYGPDLNTFFSDDYIKELASKNEWNEIFELWEFDDKYNEHNLISEVLAFFLQEIAHVDFMKYLKESSLVNFFGPMYNRTFRTRFSIISDHIIQEY